VFTVLYFYVLLTSSVYNLSPFILHTGYLILSKIVHAWRIYRCNGMRYHNLLKCSFYLRLLNRLQYAWWWLGGPFYLSLDVLLTVILKCTYWFESTRMNFLKNKPSLVLATSLRRLPTFARSLGLQNIQRVVFFIVHTHSRQSCSRMSPCLYKRILTVLWPVSNPRANPEPQAFIGRR
jgi:hypothetical protein